MSALNPLMRIEPQMLDAGTRDGGGPIWRRDGRGSCRLLAEPRTSPSAPRRLHPHQLSGGMRQRVLIGLAALCRSRGRDLADEPTTALDVVVQRQILESLVACSGALPQLDRHRLARSRPACPGHRPRRVLYAGRLAEFGPTDAVLRQPAHPYTPGLVDALPRIGDKQPRLGIEGRPPDLADLPPGCRFGRAAARHRRMTP